MNERIKELIEKTGATKSYIMYVSDDHPERYRVDEHIKIMEAFAESIVRECAGLFPAEYDAIEGKTTIGKIIKQHFGVE